jgi:peptidyl-prolyl cis-trans isomerase SurA
MPRLHRLLAVLLALAPAVVAPATGEVLLDGIAAQVDGRIVLVSDVMRAVRPQEEAMREAGAPESEIARLRAEGLERLIENSLVAGVVEDTELRASDEEIETVIEGIAEDNGLSLEQLYASVVFHGMSVEEYRAQIRGDYERRNVVNAILGPRITVEDAEVEALYRERFANQPAGGDSVHVRQILRATGGPSERDEATACAEARAARERIAAGEPFAEVAAEVSEVAPRDGGDIGWLPLDSVAGWMRAALAPLEPGDVSGVIVLPFGCSVLQLVEQRAYEPVTLEQARGRLAQEIWERKLEREYRKWLEELREHSYIERRGHFAEAARFGQQPFARGGGAGEGEGGR